MFETGTASGHKDLLNKLNTFLTATGSAFGQARSGSGNGRLSAYKGTANSVAEQFTLTATSATQFQVYGSKAGDLGVATVGVPFVSSRAAFTIEAGSTPFQAGDTLRFCTAPKWTALRAVADSEYIWKAPGNDGKGAIFTGLIERSGAGFYNLRCNGFSGFDAAKSFYDQPGALRYMLPDTYGHPAIALWTGSIPYWFVADGRRVIVIAKVSGVYQAAYLGLAEPLTDPLRYPYPLVVGGTVIKDVAYGANDPVRSNCFPMAGNTVETYTAQLHMKGTDGNWKRYTTTYEAVDTGTIHPYYVGDSFRSGMVNMGLNLDGSRPMFPVLLCQFSPADLVGQLAGVHAIPGVGTAAEQLLTVGPVNHLVVQNVHRTGNGDYFSVALD